MKILTIIALVSVILFTWGAAGYFIVSQVVMDKCINDFHATGSVVIPFKGTYCTATFWGESSIVEVSRLEEVRQSQNVVP